MDARDAVGTGRAVNDGVRIAYELRPCRRGAGAPTVVLVHGLGYARRGWGELPDRLRDELQVLLLDNRGIGDSDVPPGPYTAATMAADVVAVLDDAGFQRAHLVGSSLGGMIAQEVALGWPERVDRMVLLSTTPGGDDAVPMPQQTVELIRDMPGMAPEAALRRAVANALSPDHVTDALVDRIVAERLAVAQDAAGWQAQAHAGTTYDGGGRLGSITAPTLVLHGDQDAVVAPGNGQLLAAGIPDARLEVLAGHGHLPFWEDPGAVADALRGFLCPGA